MEEPARSVLVVDDEPMIRAICAEMLQGLGFEVSEAENGDDALIKVQASGFDIVLTDIHMPGMIDGAALARALSHHEAIGRVVIMSGNEADQDISPDAFLLKPFTFSALKAIMN